MRGVARTLFLFFRHCFPEPLRSTVIGGPGPVWRHLTHTLSGRGLLRGRASASGLRFALLHHAAATAEGGESGLVGRDRLLSLGLVLGKSKSAKSG